MADPTALWHDALQELERQLLKPQLDTWIAPIRPLHLDGGVLVLGVTNELHKAYLIKNCQDRIEETLSRLFGAPLTIRFELDVNGQGVLFAPPPVAADTAASKSARPAPAKPTPDEGGLPLNPRYIFDSFVVGGGNRFAHAAAQGVAEKLGRTHNPLFLYGGVGLGKTHLLHAIGNHVRVKYPSKRVVYTTSEKFTNDMIKSIKDQHMSDFRRKYRNMDLLLVDDIQFVQGKESTQEEFFHTINDLMSVQHQIVATSDTHPKDIKVEDRLRSRFQGGLVADLQAPDLETRIAILKKKAESEQLTVPEDVLAVIAEAVQSNIRELEGGLNRVIAFASLTGQPLTLELAREALQDLLSINKPPMTVDRIQTAVAKHFTLDPTVLSDRTRTDAVAYPRQLAMYLCRELLGASYMLIGDQFGGRDHSTVLHANEKIRRLIENDIQTKSHLTEIRKVLDA